MLTSVALALLVAVTPSATPASLSQSGAGPDDALRELYGQGQTFEAFLDGARRRRDQWHDNY